MTNPFHEGGKTIFEFAGQVKSIKLHTFMPGFPNLMPFQQVSPALHRLQLALPYSARIEYRLGVDSGQGMEEINDPANPHVAPNPYGFNSVAFGPGYLPSRWSSVRPDVARGQLVEIRVISRHFGNRRHHSLYLPPDYNRRGRYPLVVVHDGSDFLAYAALSTILDNLIAEQIVPPLLAVLLDPHERLEEYAASPRHSAHVVDEVLPHLHRRSPFSSNATDRVLLGASMGAVASLKTALDHPGVFGGLFLASGSFSNRPTSGLEEAVFEPVYRLVNDVGQQSQPLTGRIYMSVGRYEGLVDGNRHLAPLLRERGIGLLYEETWDGHHWGSWSDRLPTGLAYLFATAL